MARMSGLRERMKGRTGGELVAYERATRLKLGGVFFLSF
jgi:hypothetical protein